MQQLNDFIRGQEDRKKGIPRKEGQSREYDAGYGEQQGKDQQLKDDQNYIGRSK